MKNTFFSFIPRAFFFFLNTQGVFAESTRCAYYNLLRRFSIRSVAVVWSPSSRVGGCPGASSQHDQIVLGNRLEVRLSEPRGGDDLLLLRWRRRRGWFSENWSDSTSLLQLRVRRQVGLYTRNNTHRETSVVYIILNATESHSVYTIIIINRIAF